MKASRHHEGRQTRAHFKTLKQNLARIEAGKRRDGQGKHRVAASQERASRD